MKILVSGFEPFDGDATNPSAELLTWLTARPLPFELHTVLLPVTFSTAYIKLKSHILDQRPDVVVATGLAKKRAEITLERIAINCVDARIPDNEGVQMRDQKILNDGQDGIFSRLPLQAMLKASHEIGVPASLSSTAGEYVCNYVFYRMLHDFPGLRCGFIHLPLDPQFEVIEEMLRACAREATP